LVWRAGRACPEHQANPIDLPPLAWVPTLRGVKKYRPVRGEERGAPPPIAPEHDGSAACRVEPTPTTARWTTIVRRCHGLDACTGAAVATDRAIVT